MSKLSETHPKKSTLFIFDSCVDLAVLVIVIDTCRATAGSCNFKASRMQKMISIKKSVQIPSENANTNNDKNLLMTN